MFDTNIFLDPVLHKLQPPLFLLEQLFLLESPQPGVQWLHTNVFQRYRGTQRRTTFTPPRVSTEQSPFCGSRLPVEHSRCHKDAGLLLNPSPFLELSGKLYPDTARMGLPASGPCLGWVYVSHLLVYWPSTELYWTQS